MLLFPEQKLSRNEQFLFDLKSVYFHLVIFTVGQNSKSKVTYQQPCKCKQKITIGAVTLKNELSDEKCQLFLTKHDQRKWKVASQVWRVRWAVISLNGHIRTKAGLHDLEEILLIHLYFL